MVFGLGHHHRQEAEAYDALYEGGAQPGVPVGHEMIAGAVGFFAMREFEKRREAQGHPGSHALAKEMLAAIAIAEVERFAESRGLSYEQRERAKAAAVERAHSMYDANYGGMQLPGGDGGYGGGGYAQPQQGYPQQQGAGYY